MDQQPHTQPERPRAQVFEGGIQETVEVLPDIGQLSLQRREQGVTARLGRNRVERHVPTGVGADDYVPPSAPDRDDGLVLITYQLAAYFSLAITGLILATVIAVVVTANVAT